MKKIKVGDAVVINQEYSAYVKKLPPCAGNVDRSERAGKTGKVAGLMVRGYWVNLKGGTKCAGIPAEHVSLA